VSVGNRMKLICPNPDCINKSIVYRQFSSVKDYTCKKCGSILAAARTTKREQLTAAKAHKDLNEYEVTNTSVH